MNNVGNGGNGGFKNWLLSAAGVLIFLLLSIIGWMFNEAWHKRDDIHEKILDRLYILEQKKCQ